MFFRREKIWNIRNIDERTKKILQTIIKHCNIIIETKMYFGDKYVEFENNKIYQNAVLTPVTRIGENEIDKIKIFCVKILKEEA